MTSIKEDEKKEIPEIIRDPQTDSTYQRLRFFGKVSGGLIVFFTLRTDHSNSSTRSRNHDALFIL